MLKVYYDIESGRYLFEGSIDDINRTVTEYISYRREVDIECFMLGIELLGD